MHEVPFMSVLEIGPQDGLSSVFSPPAAGGRTFVFINALTGSLDMWETAVGPALRQAGHGTLAYNFRGQNDSPFGPGTALSPELIVEDLRTLLARIDPPRSVLTGLSIGGLFAAQAVLAGSPADGLVLINTLRRPSGRLDWINSAMVKAVATGGIPLLLDMLLPMLVNEEQLEAMRDTFLARQPYEPMDPDHGLLNLMQHASAADWDIAYEALEMPVLILTGLKDRVFYDADDVAALTKRIGNARAVELPDAGHLIPLERPDATVQALLDFAGSLGNA